MTQPQGPQPDPQSNQQPNMGPNPNMGTPPPQIMYVEKPKRPWYQRPGCLIPLILVILVVLGMASCTAMMGKTVSEVDKSLNQEKTVVYRVGGDAQDIRVTYTAGSSQFQEIASSCHQIRAKRHNLLQGYPLGFTHSQPQPPGFIPCHDDYCHSPYPSRSCSLHATPMTPRAPNIFTPKQH